MSRFNNELIQLWQISDDVSADLWVFTLYTEESIIKKKNMFWINLKINKLI